MAADLELYAREFLAISAYIAKKYPAQATRTSLFVEQQELQRLMDKNKFEESQTKLAVWRKLQWIDCEPERFSRKTRFKGKQVRMVHLRCSVNDQLLCFFAGNNAGNTA